MIDFENDLNLLRCFSATNIKAWRRRTEAHEAVMQLMQQGILFTKLGFPREDYSDADSRSESIKAAITSLFTLMNCSYEPKKGLGQCVVKDVFYDGMASRALDSVFFKSGWSRRVWRGKQAKNSSFRAAIGMAMVVYALYIKKSMAEKDYERAMLQCADAFGLLVMDREKKLANKNKENEAKINEMPALILSSQGKKAVEKNLRMTRSRLKKHSLKNVGLSGRKNQIFTKGRLRSHAICLANVSI